MEQVRAVGLSRGSAPAFVPVYEWEAVRLRQVPPWMRWLFWELLGLSSFKTGKGRTSWAQLASLLDWDKPERGRRAAPDISMQQVRRAFEQLAGLGLVARDAGANQTLAVLDFVVMPRASKSAPKRKTDRVSDKVSDRASTEVKQAQIQQDQPGDFRQVDQQKISTPLPPTGGAAGEATKPPAALKALRRSLSKVPPQGGENKAPKAPGAPPGAVPPVARSGVPLTPSNSPPRGATYAPHPGRKAVQAARTVGSMLDGLKQPALESGGRAPADADGSDTGPQRG